MLLFPNFQRTFVPRFARDDNFFSVAIPRFFNGSAKVRACIFLPNFFSILFELFGVKINLFGEELCFFKKRAAKIGYGKLPAKFCPLFYSHLAHNVFTKKSLRKIVYLFPVSLSL